MLQETKARQVFRKFAKISGGKKCSFFGKFGALCFIVTPVLRFAHLPYHRRIMVCFTSFFNGKAGKFISNIYALTNLTHGITTPSAP